MYIRRTGTIQRFNPDRGFGVIIDETTSQENPDRFFFYRSDITIGPVSPTPGQRVSFQVDSKYQVRPGMLPIAVGLRIVPAGAFAVLAGTEAPVGPETKEPSEGVK